MGTGGHFTGRKDDHSPAFNAEDKNSIHNFWDWSSHLVKNSLWAYWPHPRNSPHQEVCIVPSASDILKCIMEVVVCEGVQHRLRFCLDHLNCVKMTVLQFYLQLGKRRKVGWAEDDSHVVSVKKFPGEKGSVRLCVVVMQQPISLSPKFGAKSSRIFTQSP
jgi:hypothetical protein